MIDRDFHKAITGAFNERRNETVHAFERHKRADAFAFHCFQSAPCVADAILCETAPDKICDAARDPFYHGVLALRAITRSEEHTSELQSLRHLVCRLLLEK